MTRDARGPGLSPQLEVRSDQPEPQDGPVASRLRRRGQNGPAVGTQVERGLQSGHLPFGDDLAGGGVAINEAGRGRLSLLFRFKRNSPRGSRRVAPPVPRARTAGLPAGKLAGTRPILRPVPLARARRLRRRADAERTPSPGTGSGSTGVGVCSGATVEAGPEGTAFGTAVLREHPPANASNRATSNTRAQRGLTARLPIKCERQTVVHTLG